MAKANWKTLASLWPICADAILSLPFTLAGFSFGSRIALRLGCEGAGARRVIAVGFRRPTKTGRFLEDCTVPRIFIQSTRDQFGPISDLEPLVAGLPEPKKLVLVEARITFSPAPWMFLSGNSRLD